MAARVARGRLTRLARAAGPGQGGHQAVPRTEACQHLPTLSSGAAVTPAPVTGLGVEPTLGFLLTFLNQSSSEKTRYRLKGGKHRLTDTCKWTVRL